jgi:2-keto-4-pentenoate hydratase/2-oxohepta-3-ene-1,7-dioic acid hydratase in catechol pathway
MKLVTYIHNDIEKVGVLSQDEKSVLPIASIKSEFNNMDMMSFIKNFKEEYIEILNTAANEGKGIPVSEVKLAAPIPEPTRVICIGKNYREHIKELAATEAEKNYIPEEPIYFSKLVDRAVEPEGIIPFQGNVSTQVDYEVELAVVIGKTGKNIPMEEVEDYIFGYTILNDVSIRDIQRRHVQWLRGKSLDGTCPIGPHIVHKSLIKFPVELDIKSYVNGELRQNSNTREYIYDIPYFISEFSKGITLKPGDIIATGTPAGVGAGFNPPKFLKPGDVVECVVENIGTLRNKVL